jgi:bla regulator protein blaR1
MKKLQDLFSTSWTEALGWSLLHSVWQGLLITIIVFVALKCISIKSSRLRYAICSIALLVTLAATVVTFSLLLTEEGVQFHSFQLEDNQVTLLASTQNQSSLSLFEAGKTWLISGIERNMSLILYGWIVGTILFSLRILSGWMYLMKIKNNAIVLENDWSKTLQALATKLDLNLSIALAESTEIETPMVIGYLKPIVLVPVGLFSGLTTEQIETIFLHELAHIRRHDYLINLIQSIVEAVLFFNPFIWILSAMIRREREYCCDDTVISKHGSALAYAHALTQLEEARLNRNVLALNLAENRNQLLNRIKRIMEKSVKPYTGIGRLVPVLLVFVGLTCASWLTIQAQDEKKKNQQSDESGVVNDSTRKKSEKSARYTYKRSVVTNEDAEPVVEVIDAYEGDEELRPVIAPMDLLVMPSPPDVIINIPDMPDVQPMVMPVAPMFPMGWDIDTTRRSHRFRNSEEWKAFNKEFETKFKEQFEDFYKKHEKDISKMMNELTEKFENKYSSEEWRSLAESFRANADLERMQAEITRAQIPFEAMEEARVQAALASADVQQHQLEVNEILEKDMAEMNRNMAARAEDMRRMEKDLRALEENMKAFEKALKEQLVKDGYIDKNETVKEMHWSDDGAIQINGKKIKESDEKKYRELHRKYLKEKPDTVRFIVE